MTDVNNCTFFLGLLAWRWTFTNIPLTPSSESCSDWTENFRVAAFVYWKNIMFYALIFFISHYKKLLTKLYFLFLKICNSALFINMLQNSYVCFSLMSPELLAHCSIISYTHWVMISNVTKILEKTWKCTVRKKFQIVFPTFFPVDVPQSNPLLSFYIKKTKNVHYFF